MDKFSLRKEIASLINSIKEHSDSIGDKQHIPQIELELILQKIEKLYKKSIVFNHLNSMPEITANRSEEKPLNPTTVNQVVEPVPEVVQEKPIDLFGSELPPVAEKPKPEKKVEKKEERKEVKKEERREEAATVAKPKIMAITDLKAAIGINDRFQFANELFAGNMQEYNIAIQQLNASESLESAMFYFESLKQLYDWDAENETVKRLISLIDRRYS